MKCRVHGNIIVETCRTINIDIKEFEIHYFVNAMQRNHAFNIRYLRGGLYYNIKHLFGFEIRDIS